MLLAVPAIALTSMRIDGNVPGGTWPIAATAIDACPGQYRPILVRQPRHLAQMIGPAFHRPYLHPSLGMGHVLIELPKHGTSTAAYFANLGHGVKKVAAVFLVHLVMHGLHNPTTDAAKGRYQFGRRRFGQRQGLRRP